VPRLPARFARGDKNQVIVVQLAPAAHVRVAKLKEIDRAIMFAVPSERQNSLLPWIDLDKRTRTDNGVQRAILHANVTIKIFVPIDWAHFQVQFKAWRESTTKSLMPEAAREHQVLAEYAFKEKNTDKAMLEYTEALKVFSTWPEGQFNLATLCGEAKHYQCAVLHMKEYLELAPDSPDAQAAKDSIIIWNDKLSAFRAAIAQESPTAQPGKSLR
jgi:tetratricopeptide (TPR) repeat protein